MRRYALATVLMLSACGSDPVPTANETGASEDQPAAMATPSPVALTAIPVRFVGTWDVDAAACRAPTAGEMRLAITPQSLRFYEAEARTQAVADAGDGAVDIDAVTTGEGITEQRRYRLTLAEKGSIDVTVGGATARRVRCDAPAGAGEAARNAGALTLAPDGLLVVSGARSRTIAFGSPAEQALRVAEAATRALPVRGQSGDCGAGALDFATFPGVRLWFQQDRFVGWTATGRGPTTMAGVGIGSTRAQVDDVIVAPVESTSLGDEFTSGGMSGVYDESGTVRSLWAGTTCIAR